MNTAQKKILGLVLLGIIVFVVVTYLLVQKSAPSIPPETIAAFANPEDGAPYTDLQGNPISLDQYLGNILVVATWASWSPFSTQDIATLRELSAMYSKQGVIFMAINRKETKEQAARFVATLPSLEGLVVALDPRDAFYTAVGGYAMPEVVVYNSQGEIAEHFRGVASKESIEAVLQRLFTE